MWFDRTGVFDMVFFSSVFFYFIFFLPHHGYVERFQNHWTEKSSRSERYAINQSVAITSTVSQYTISPSISPSHASTRIHCYTHTLVYSHVHIIILSHMFIRISGTRLSSMYELLGPIHTHAKHTGHNTDTSW